MYDTRKHHDHGQRRWIFGGLVLWALGTPLAGSLLNLPWSAFAWWAADHLPRQPSALVAALGVALALSLATGWLVGFASESLIVLHHLRLYRLAGLDRETKRDGAAARRRKWRIINYGARSICT